MPEAGEFTLSGHGFEVTITRSAGTDGAVVVLVDGPDRGPSGEERDLLPDGSPRCRVLLNDHAVYEAVPFEGADED